MEIFSKELPKPKIKTRKCDPEVLNAGKSLGLHPIIARVLAGRQRPVEFTLEQILAPKLTHLLAPQAMADMERAAERVAMAILEGQCIGIETDHDCDGQTSHAVLYYNLVNRFLHPTSKIRSYIGHRLKEGYGLSESVARRILADEPRPQLIITADNGSSDEARIEKLKENGIDVIVTDHHEIPVEGVPKSAYACLNPTREDCGYEDPYIAGCMVAWLLMAATRKKLIELHYLPENFPSLADSLDFVAVGTVADCVSIARSQNNRAVVTYGLKLIDAATRPCWRAIKTLLSGPLRSSDLGFLIGPLLNSDGRLASAFGSVSFLLSETDEEAFEWVQSLKLQNEQRKQIQRSIVNASLSMALEQVSQGRNTICIYLADGHTGVQGIAASRIKEAFGRPTVIFADKLIPVESIDGINNNRNNKEDNETEVLITGSARGIEEFHVREALQRVADLHPGLLISFGGHKGAGGLTLKLKDFECFKAAFEQATREQLQKLQVNESKQQCGNRYMNEYDQVKENEQINENDTNFYLGPILWTDGELEHQNVNLELFDELLTLEPYGREFEPPVFELTAKLTDIRPIGDGTHARLTLAVDHHHYNGIWFGMRSKSSDRIPVAIGDHVRVIFSLRDNHYRGRRSCDIHVVHMERVS